MASATETVGLAIGDESRDLGIEGTVIRIGLALYDVAGKVQCSARYPKFTETPSRVGPDSEL